jgi:hypothetical protein
MADQQTAKLAEPGVGAFDDPAAAVAAQLASVLVLPVLVVLPVGNDEFDATLPQALAQRVGVVGAIRNHALRLAPRTALGAWDRDCGERGFRKRSFSRRGTFQPNSQRKTLTVDQYHPLRALAPLGFSDRSAPFFAGAKLPSRKVSSHCNKPSPSSAPNSARQACNQTPCSSHCFRRRQQVGGEGYLSGRKRQADPVRRIHRMPSKHARFEAQGRPRLSFRRLGGGNIGSINSHCSSVTNCCRFFIEAVVQKPGLIRKYLF